MANIYEVAELAGVSLATVSRVINPGAKVSDQTRQKVLDAMRQLGYRPNSIAQSLATRSSNSVGVLVSELHGPFFGALLSAVEKTLKAAGKFVLVAAGHNDEQMELDAIRFLTSRNCDALIVHAERLPDKFLIDHDHNTTPLVIMNRKVRGLAEHCFSLNNEQGGYLATQALVKRKHKRIAYISGPLDWVDAKQRLAGHKRALTQAGVKFDERLLHEGDYHETGGQDALNALLAKNLPFSAVVCANDEMAAGAMAAAHERGLELPRELSIVGFDDAPIARYVYPKLTTVHYPIADMGTMAARWVLKHVYDQPQDVQQVFEPKLVERDSVAKA
jgi:LacI family transcriptional regulator, galactose operon repressor